jgi:hypothetical protein
VVVVGVMGPVAVARALVAAAAITTVLIHIAG